MRMDSARRAEVGLGLAVLLAVLVASAPAAQGIVDRFDHYRTGFPLDGRHGTVRCESCHGGGSFAGTPRECVGCHDNRHAEGKPFRHIPTAAACETCHTTLDWRTSRFDHTDYSVGCVRCHNNFIAPGKTLTHPATDEVCENCHNTIHWNQILATAPPSGAAIRGAMP